MLLKGPRLIIHKLTSLTELGKHLEFADLTRDMTVKVQAHVPRGQGLGRGVQLSFNAGMTVHLVVVTVLVLQ